MNLAAWLRIGSKLEQEYNVGEDTLSERIDQAKTYVDNRLYRADVVSTLPADAPPGYLMVKAGDINLYVGAGAGTPLRKLPTQPA